MFCEKGKHVYISTTLWGPFELVHNIYVSQKTRVQECTHCGHQRSLPITECKRYGSSLLPFSLDGALEGEVLSLTRSLLLDLVTSATRKKWDTWKRKWVETNDYSLFDECVERLFHWGLVIKQEKKTPDRIHSWETKYISSNMVFLESDIARLLGLEIASALPDTALSDIGYDNLNPTTAKGRQIKELIDKLRNEKSTPTTLRVLQALQGIFNLVEEQRSMSWKIFSQTYFGSTKALGDFDKVRLRNLLGSKLSDFGIRSSSSRVLISGDFSWEIHGYLNHGLGFLGSLSLPRNMIHRMTVVSWKSPHLLIIENKDLFESLVDSQRLDPRKWAILFGKGFLSSEEIELIGHASKYSLKSITIWPDLDPFGLSIALNLKERLIDSHIPMPLFIFGFSIDWANRFKVKLPLTPKDLDEIERLKKNPLPPNCLQVIEWMLDSNQKSEQEMAFELIELDSLEDALLQEVIKL